MILSLLKSIWRADHGAALVESAIILPVFLTLVGGVYEFGFFFINNSSSRPECEMPLAISH
jgi:Flp pilus assembly protein TadG